jgi:broad specificity phosphatase PhoE
MTQFYLIRHGEADYSLADAYKLIGGAREWVPLTDRGVEQVGQLGQRLQTVPAQIILASPIPRALQTAALLSRSLDLTLQVEFDLHEWIPDRTFRYDSSEESLSNFYEMMALNGEWPEGEERVWEPMSVVRQRVHGVLRRYVHLESVFVICHGAIIRCLTDETVDVAEYHLYPFTG